MTNDNRDDTTPPHLHEPYPLAASFDMPPTREVSSAQQIETLREKIVRLAELRRADLEAMEAAQSLLLPTNAGMIRSAFDMLESRTGWMQRMRQAVACEGPLEGD